MTGTARRVTRSQNAEQLFFQGVLTCKLYSPIVRLKTVGLGQIFVEMASLLN